MTRRRPGGGKKAAGPTAPPGTFLVEVGAEGVVYRHYYPSPGLSAESVASLVARAVSNGDPLLVEWTASDTQRRCQAVIVFTDKVAFVRTILRPE